VEQNGHTLGTEVEDLVSPLLLNHNEILLDNFNRKATETKRRESDKTIGAVQTCEHKRTSSALTAVVESTSVVAKG
jgi:hypothetical protein